MKYIFISLTILLSFNTFALEKKNFSAIGKGEESIYVSVKKIDPKNGTSSSLYELNDQNKKEIKLSDDLKEREIVGIFSKNKRLFVISQMTTEQGDNPVIFENVKNKWNKIKEVECQAFTKIELEKNSLTFFCEKEDKNTSKMTQFNKIVTIKDLNFEKKLTLPQNEITDSKLNAKLEGIPFEWDKVRVMNVKSKDYNVSEF